MFLLQFAYNSARTWEGSLKSLTLRGGGRHKSLVFLRQNKLRAQRIPNPRPQEVLGILEIVSHNKGGKFIGHRLEFLI